MEEITQAIREKARALLEKGQVEAVLGFCRGTLPMARRPFLAKTPEQAENLCWDAFCLMNLANFLPSKQSGRIAVVAKGCDWRNLLVHESENLIDIKTGIEVLGIACTGMIDPVKIHQAAGGADRVVDVTVSDHKVEVTCVGGDCFSLETTSLYRQSCLECRQPAPEASTLICRPADNFQARHPTGLESSTGSTDVVASIDWLKETFESCLMCFACRDACPLCYCRHCFVDTEKPYWLSPTRALDGLLDFHFFRAHHIAGRCTGCGSCESACPMNIPVRELVKKLNRDIEESKGYIPGISTDMEVPADIFRPSYHETQKGR